MPTQHAMMAPSLSSALWADMEDSGSDNELAPRSDVKAGGQVAPIASISSSAGTQVDSRALQVTHEGGVNVHPHLY